MIYLDEFINKVANLLNIGIFEFLIIVVLVLSLFSYKDYASIIKHIRKIHSFITNIIEDNSDTIKKIINAKNNFIKIIVREDKKLQYMKNSYQGLKPLIKKNSKTMK